MRPSPARLKQWGIVFVFVQLLARALPVLAQTAQTSTLTPATAGAVDAAVQAECKRQQIVGLAIGIIRERRIVYLKGYGMADREAGAPVTTRTVFNWASNTKPLTAFAAMQLVERKQLDLDADIRTYVPEFPDKGAVITMRHLLSHESGLPHYDNENKGKVVPTLHPGSAPVFETVMMALDRFNRSPLLFKPGEKSSYSSYGYILASAVIERAGKQDFFRQLQERIARPLGMTSLQLDVERTNQPDWAACYEKNEKGQIVRRAHDDAEYWKYGAGGIKSNIEDFARWGQAVINGTLVSKESERELWTSRPAPPLDDSLKLLQYLDVGFGLGFAIEDHEGSLKLDYNGGGQGVSTRTVLYPRAKHGIVLMANCDFPDAGMDDFLNLQRVSTAIYRALDREE